MRKTADKPSERAKEPEGKKEEKEEEFEDDKEEDVMGVDYFHLKGAGKGRAPANVEKNNFVVDQVSDRKKI